MGVVRTDKWNDTKRERKLDQGLVGELGQGYREAKEGREGIERL